VDKRNSQAVIDIETNKAWDTIWMCGVYFPDSKTKEYATNVQDLHRLLSGVDTVVGHNILGFDLPILREVWGFDWNQQYFDTLVMGRLLNPMIEGGHSLRAWAERAGGELKDEFTDFDGGLTDDMIDYCLQDCVANWSVFEYMETLIEERGFSWESVTLEHEVRRITTQQEKNGFAFDFPKACQLHSEHSDRMQDITTELQEIFPPIVEARYSEKTGKQLKDRVTVFNPGSRQQVAERLAGKGAVWKKLTETGKPKVDEKTLEQNAHVPEAALVLEYLTLSKRIGMLRSWLDAVSAEGRIHGRVNTCGAITGRMSHSKPNMAQIPSESCYRECFTVAPGKKLVGIDASGLELRMLAHYMQDEEYIGLILHGDIHTHTQNLAGLPSRNDAKTFIYALLYGAGDEKIGSIVGGNALQGAKMRKQFIAGLPAYGKLVDRIKKLAQTGSIPGLDGRRINIRSEHAALNTLLQGAGAVVMKYALVIAVKKLADYGYPYKLVAQVHDEYQVEVPEEYAQRVGVVFRNSIREAGRELNLRCPMDGEYQIGTTWADTH
jgi:DNA polymerase I-like protein with 3'-5' exonuclease and polymerase domains